VTEDNYGQIYIGTGRGLDRLDPQSLHIKHYRTTDGLLLGKITSAFRDQHGSLWFASNVHGLSRFTPRADEPEPPPTVLISGLRIAGVVRPISQLGETDVARLELAPNQNELNIDFVGLSFSPGETLRYQYELEGADEKWSQPEVQRSVNYANLAAGRYRFLVRAINADGVASTTPATLAFIILPPIWERWWFLMLAVIVFALTAYAVHRQRVAQSVALERIRTRIATDLHDDIGANLSLIAMLSDVARTQLQRDDARLKEWFSTIATTSRDTVDSMSDIVWAVNPKRDQLRDLTRRMRRFADDIFAARNINLQFRAPEPERDLKIGAEVRRETFLIFKETINNIARHSQCTSVTMSLSAEHGWLVLTMCDNGKGIESSQTNGGLGLISMNQRASKLGGTFEVISRNGSGTTVTLKVPLDKNSRL
jgi:signal transduction histidine kinase